MKATFVNLQQIKLEPENRDEGLLLGLFTHRFVAGQMERGVINRGGISISSEIKNAVEFYTLTLDEEIIESVKGAR